MSRRRSVPLAVAADRRARFEAVFVQVYEPLQAYAHRRTDAATADDVVAETLLVLWRRLEEAPVDQIVPWAYGVAPLLGQPAARRSAPPRTRRSPRR